MKKLHYRKHEDFYKQLDSLAKSECEMRIIFKSFEILEDTNLTSRLLKTQNGKEALKKIAEIQDEYANEISKDQAGRLGIVLSGTVIKYAITIGALITAFIFALLIYRKYRIIIVIIKKERKNRTKQTDKTVIDLNPSSLIKNASIELKLA